MQTLFFFANRPDLVVVMRFFGFLASGYALQLVDVDGVTPLFNPPFTGVNTDNQPDQVALPTPVSVNHNRFLEAVISFRGSDPDNFPNYIIDLELRQEGILIGKESRSGSLTGEVQRQTITIRLQAR